MLKNRSFEGGTYRPWPELDNLNVPNEWSFWYAKADYPNPHDPNPWAEFQQPEMHALHWSDLPEDERDLFILDGDHTLKAFKGSGSWYGQLFQEVGGLEIGADYRVTARIFADLVKEYSNGDKVWADDPEKRDGLVRFLVDGAPLGDLGDWLNLDPGHQNELAATFTAREAEHVLTVEIMCPFPLVNSGVFCDNWTLERVTDPPPRGIPREEYPRTYHVIPADTPPDKATAIFREVWDDHPQTVGPSYDDAGIGDLDERDAVLHRLLRIEQPDYVDFFAQYYPGVNVTFENVIEPPDDPPLPPPGTMSGLHLQSLVEYWDTYTANAKPGAVKLFQLEPGQIVNAVSPDTLVIFRHHIAHQKPYLYAEDKRKAARDFIDLFRDSLETNAEYIDVVLGLNEYIGTDDIEGIEHGVAWAEAFAHELIDTGIPVVPGLLSVAVGNPQHGEQTEMLLPAARAAVDTEGYLVYHAYWPPGRLTADWRHYAGRALDSWDPTFGKFGVYPKYIFGEVGVVGARPGGGLEPQAGWRDPLAYSGDWPRYRTDLVLFDSLVNDWNAYHGNRARGGTIFTSGFAGWDSFQIRKEQMQSLEMLP